MNIIVAVDEHGGIGKDNQLPWRNKADMNWFRTMTIGGTVVMGRNTWKSLGEKPLKDRLNIVLSTKYVNRYTENVCFLKDLPNQFIQKDTFVIGGEFTYNTLASKCDTIYLSKIPGIYDCDTFFEIPKNFYKVGSITLSKGIDNVVIERYLNDKNK